MTADGGLKNATIKHKNVSAKLDWASGCPIVTAGFADEKPLHTDLPHRTYVLDGPGVAHYSRYDRGSLHLGLGE